MIGSLLKSRSIVIIRKLVHIDHFYAQHTLDKKVTVPKLFSQKRIERSLRQLPCMSYGLRCPCIVPVKKTLCIVYELNVTSTCSFIALSLESATRLWYVYYVRLSVDPDCNRDDFRFHIGN